LLLGGHSGSFHVKKSRRMVHANFAALGAVKAIAGEALRADLNGVAHALDAQAGAQKELRAVGLHHTIVLATSVINSKNELSRGKNFVLF
jgi:hypothetical protein